MRIQFLRFTLLFLCTVIFAPLGDYGHVSSQTTTYLWDGPLRVLLSPLWFLAAVGVFSIALGTCTDFLKKQFFHTTPKRQVGFNTVISGLTGMMTIYATTALLPREHLAITTICMVSAALFLWATVDGTSLGLCMALIGGILGVTSEIILVALGTFKYHDQINSFFGVAPWLFSIHFSFGLCVKLTQEWSSQFFAKQN